MSKFPALVLVTSHQVLIERQEELVVRAEPGNNGHLRRGMLAVHRILQFGNIQSIHNRFNSASLSGILY